MDLWVWISNLFAEECVERKRKILNQQINLNIYQLLRIYIFGFDNQSYFVFRGRQTQREREIGGPKNVRTDQKDFPRAIIFDSVVLSLSEKLNRIS